MEAQAIHRRVRVRVVEIGLEFIGLRLVFRPSLPEGRLLVETPHAADYGSKQATGFQGAARLVQLLTWPMGLGFSVTIPVNGSISRSGLETLSGSDWIW